jgi:hypothetical protein
VCMCVFVHAYACMYAMSPFHSIHAHCTHKDPRRDNFNSYTVCKHTGIHADRLADRQTERQTDRH